MPLMMGDWIKGTRGMRADVKGVYIGLLIHQYDHGYLPADVEELSLIEPEVGKVWVKLKEKFEEFEPGRLRNKKLEEVRDFWSKQASNGKKGGRPKTQKPEVNPNNNPEPNPNTKLHYDLDPDIDIDLRFKEAFDEIYLEDQEMKWPQLDFKFQFRTFCEKVRGSPEHYRLHTTNGLRLALQKQLRDAKPNTKNRKQSTSDLATAFAERVRADVAAGKFQGG